MCQVAQDECLPVEILKRQRQLANGTAVADGWSPGLRACGARRMGAGSGASSSHARASAGPMAAVAEEDAWEDDGDGAGGAEARGRGAARREGRRGRGGAA